MKKQSTAGRNPFSDPGEPGYLPEVGEELFDLSLQAVDVAPRHRRDVTRPGTIERMMQVRRIVKLAALALGLVTYVWFAAVRATPSVKRRKALRRNRPR